MIYLLIFSFGTKKNDKIHEHKLINLKSNMAAPRNLSSDLTQSYVSHPRVC